MSYQEFGLDAVKRSQDAGEKSAVFYDPWSWQQVGGRNFYLCFSNWVVSPPTIDAFASQEPVEALPGDKCQKCNQAKPLLHYCIAGKEELNRDLGICPDCVQWAAEYLSKPEPPPPAGTQLGLLGTRVHQPVKKHSKPVSASPTSPPKPPKPGQLNLF